MIEPFSYSQFKFVFYANASDGNNYIAINEVAMYEAYDGSGPNLFTGGVATANGHYTTSTIAPNAIDGNLTTYWESSNRAPSLAASPAELTIVLAAPVSPRSLRVVSSTYMGERPRNFSVLGSNDGVTWDNVLTFTDFFVGSEEGFPTDKLHTFNFHIRGVSKLDNGMPAQRVMIADWETGNFIANITPNDDGEWLCVNFSSYRPVYVLHIGPSGYRPHTDGPITPYGW